MALVAPILITVTAACGSDNNARHLDASNMTDAAMQAPAFTIQPTSQSVVVPATATFTVTVTGSPAPNVQWQKSDDGATFVDIAGATGSSYTTPATAVADDGSLYRAVASNVSGTTNSDVATLTVSASNGPSKIVFTRGDGTVANLDDLWVIDEDGTGALQLTTTPEAEGVRAVYGDRVVFVRLTSNGQDIYSVKTDGTGLATLAATADDEYCWGVTSTGRVIFSKLGNIYAVNADGTDSTTLAATTDQETFDAISAGGRVIYRRDTAAGNADLYSVAADGTGTATLLASTSDDYFQAVTSTGAVIGATCQVDLCTYYSIDQAGGAATTLGVDTFQGEFSWAGNTEHGVPILMKRTSFSGPTDLYAHGSTPLADSTDDERYSGSNAAGRVFYRRYIGPSGAQSDLYAVGEDGANTTALANTSDNELLAGVAPDGRVVFGRDAGGQQDLYIVDDDGTGLTALTTNAQNDEFKGFAGNRVVFERAAGTTIELHAVGLDGTAPTPLATTGGHNFFVAATPSGKVLVRRQSNNADLYIVNADGTGLVPLATTAANEFLGAIVP